MKIQPKLMLAPLVLGAALALSVSSVSAAGYSQAPPTGNDTGAEFLITWDGTNFSISAASGEGPFDGIEDTLFGIQNNSNAPLMSINLTGSNIFGFDGDGINVYNGTGGPPGSPGPTGYEGWTSLTSAWNNMGGQEATSFTVVDSDHGTVNFGVNGIAPGGSAYFALEEHVTGLNCGPNGCSQGTPDTGSTLSLMAIACALGLVLKRRFCQA
jgi:hypothetical protein